MNRQLILAIDIGTSSVRAALFDLSGTLLPKTLVKNERTLHATREGGAEIDADLAFRQVVATVDDVLAKTKNSRSVIVAVAASSFWHSLLGVDKEGKPTTKVLGWADNRGRDFVAELRKRIDEHGVHQRTGARFHSSFWPAKLMWFRRVQPDVFARTAKWISFSDYVAMRLSGSPATSISMAAATGIFDQLKCSWDQPLLRFLKIKREQLPQIADSSDNFRLSKTSARRWPRLAAAKWFFAIGDGAANNIGAGCVTRSRAALMVGTSGAMRVAYSGEPPKKLSPGLWCYRIDRQRVIVGGALSDGGGLYSWLKDKLQLPKNVEAIISKRAPRSDALTFLPFVAGERSTGYHENAAGAIIGLTDITDTVDIVEAAMASVAYRFAAIADEMAEVAEFDEIIASGGALRNSHVWTGLMSDVLGRALVLAPVPEASLRGTVLLALETLGNIESIDQKLPANGQVFEPNMEYHAIHRDARRRHQSFYDLIINNS